MPPHPRGPQGHTDDGWPKREECEQAWPNWIGIGIRPQPDGRQDDDAQQGTATKYEKPEADLEEATLEIAIHGPSGGLCSDFTCQFSPYDDRGASRCRPSACWLQRPVRRRVPRLGFNRPFQMPASSTVLSDERPGCLQGGFLLDTDPRRRINDAPSVRIVLEKLGNNLARSATDSTGFPRR